MQTEMTIRLQVSLVCSVKGLNPPPPHTHTVHMHCLSTATFGGELGGCITAEVSILGKDPGLNARFPLSELGIVCCTA